VIGFLLVQLSKLSITEKPPIQAPQQNSIISNSTHEAHNM